jgi:glycosyltransferase involved in cell wall biosynthesis
MLGFRDAGMSVHLLCRIGSVIEAKAKEEGFVTRSYKNVWGVIFCLLTKGRKYDFIHSQTSQILTYCILTKPFVRTPIIFTRRVDFVPKGFFTKLKYRFTDKIIGVSKAIKDILHAFCKREDIEVIYDIGVKMEPDVNFAKQKLASVKINGRRIVATTSALTGHKDPLTCVAAIKKLVSKRNDFVFLHFGYGDLEEEVAKAIQENQLQDTYLMMGFVEKVENFFPLFEVFVMTSQEEGLGSSVLDAFLYKIPVVSTNAGGLKELINNERGIVCNVKDADAIAEGINSILENSEKGKKFLNNAYDYASKYHGMKYITDQYVALMQEIKKNN